VCVGIYFTMMVKIRCILVLRNAVCMNKPTGNQVLQLCLACFFAERMSLVNGHQVVHGVFADSASDDNASGSEGYEMLLLFCLLLCGQNVIGQWSSGCTWGFCRLCKR